MNETKNKIKMNLNVCMKYIKKQKILLKRITEWLVAAIILLICYNAHEDTRFKQDLILGVESEILFHKKKQLRKEKKSLEFIGHLNRQVICLAISNVNDVTLKHNFVNIVTLVVIILS